MSLFERRATLALAVTGWSRRRHAMLVSAPECTCLPVAQFRVEGLFEVEQRVTNEAIRPRPPGGRGRRVT